MEKLATGFVFTRKDSIIHELDPRVRLLLSAQLLSLSLLPSSIWEAMVSLTGIIIIVSTAKILRRFTKSLVYTSIFSAIIFLANYFINENLFNSILPSLRFLSVVGSGSFFFLTTTPDELEYVASFLRVPREVAFAFTTAIRFIPVLMLDAVRITDAQRSRGLELEKGNPLMRIRNLFPILIPLILSAIIRSGELAEAMETRAYSTKKRKTSFLSFNFNRRDLSIMLASLTIFTLLAYQYVIGSW